MRLGRRALALGLGAAACSRRTRDARGRVIVRFWYSLGGEPRRSMLEIIRRFHAAQDDVWIEPVYQGNYFESLAKLRTAIAARAAPALSHVVAEVVPYLVRAGTLAPLEGLRDLRFVDPLGQSGAFRGGGDKALYGVPLNRSTPIMYCNGDLFAKAGLAPPATWKELVDAARALTIPGQRFGYSVPIAWWFWVALVGQAGGAVFDDAGRATLGGAAGDKALRYWQDLVHRDKVMRPPPGRDYDAWEVVNQDFLSGRVAFVTTSTAYIRKLERDARFQVVASPLPRDVKRSVPTGGTFFVVVQQAPAEEREAAAKFLRFCCEAEHAAFVASRTGYLPVTEDAVALLERQGFYAQHPNDVVARSQLAVVEPWPWEPNLFRIERDIVEPRLEEAVLFDRDAKTVLDEARAIASRPA